MSDNYVIEIRPHSANVTLHAGIVVRDGRSFIFFTASDVFNPLDGQRFDSPRAAQQAALRRIADVVSRKIVTQVNAASPNEIGEATGAKYASTAPQPGVRNRNARNQHAWNRP
jgi:hypothetical protein